MIDTTIGLRHRRLALLLCVILLGTAQAYDGDIDGNRVVDSADLLLGQQAAQGMRILSPEGALHADVAPLSGGVPQPDGVLDLGDLLLLQRIALGYMNFLIPGNQFNIGDSIGEGEAADGTIGEAHHESVWSTGFAGGDGVLAFNERFEAAAAADYYENNASRDSLFNHALSGSEMIDFAAQANAVIAAMSQAPSGSAQLVTVFLGNNDVCAGSLGDMTDRGLFEAQYRAGLEVLANNSLTRGAQIHVSGIPAIYWLWNAKRSVFWCRVFAWPFVPCENLLDNPADDCANSTSREDPDTVYPGDGSNCQRRKEFHRRIRDVYNPILRDVLAQYRESGRLPNARYTDVFDVRFDSNDVNGGDCFHPSYAGHARLANTAWCRTPWGKGDPVCTN